MRIFMKCRGFFTILLLSGVLGSVTEAAAPMVVVKKVDESIATGSLSGLADGRISLTSPDAKISLDDLAELTFKSGGGAVGSPVTLAIHKLTGKVIGTEGSYNDEGNTRDKAFDGDLDTFFDAPNDHGDDAWVGLDLGSPKVITEIKYAPRSDQRDMMQRRMIGGIFQGCDSADFHTKITDLTAIKSKPEAAKFTSVQISNTNAFRYVRYLSPPQGIGNVAEIEFWGHDPGAVIEKRSTGKTATKRAVSASKPVVAATKPITAGASIRVILADAEQLNGPMLGWSEKALRVATGFSEDGGLDIPVEALREVWKGTADEVKKAKALSLAEGPEDAAFVLKDKDIVVVRGIVLGVEGESLRFKFNDEERKINLSKLVGVILGGNADKRDRSFRQTVQLSSGDSLSGQWNRFDPATNSIGLQMPWGASLSIPASQIVRIRSTNGRLVYVSDLKPAAVEQTPYFDRMLTYRVDKSLIGGPLKLSDGEYAHGIAVHSRTVLTYDIDGSYEEFKTKVGFQQPEGKLGQAIVRIVGDGKTLYENVDARGDQPPVDVSLKIANVRRLTLEVDFGKNEDAGDRVIWANARLLRAKK
jgi:hypothetical protein